MGKISSIQREAKRDAARTLPEAGLPTVVTAPLKAIINSTFALDELGRQPMPAKTSFLLGRRLKVIREAAEDYEKTRIALCEKYGVLNKETGNYDIEPEKQKRFNREIEDLLGAEVTLNISPIRLGTIEKLVMSGESMARLDWLIIADNE